MDSEQPGAAGPAAVDFPGCGRFIRMIDQAVASGDEHAVTAAVRDALCAAMRDPDIRLPDCVHTPADGHYARRELYRSARHGYSVVAMTWAPGQGTPLHDHSGLWCVEGVWKGDLEIVQYELLERDGERFRFRAAGGLHAGPGSAGSLIPPHEFHTIRNNDPAAIAISLHVYERPMDACATFEPCGGEWFERHGKALRTDAAA